MAHVRVDSGLQVGEEIILEVLGLGHGEGWGLAQRPKS